LPELKPGIDDFINIARLLETLGCDYQIDIASGRGFEYYTGIIFQFFKNGEKLGGGGRYDALIPLMGGKDTPASGFALYLDQLINLVKPEALAKRQAQRILIRAEPEAVREGFSIASRLREAGYMAELYLGAQKQADFNWRLDVKSKPPLFILTDQAKHQRFEAKTADEVLALLAAENL
jgi:histidyl-tRNA synthetase